ncbi:MAG: phage tail assembly protein [Alphaproteobacteria bacterium]
MKYPLKKPITVADKKIEYLEIRENIIGADMKGVKISKDGEIDFAVMLTLISHLSAQPPAIIDKIDIVDLFPLIEKVSDFLSPSQETGKTQ